MSSYKLQNSPPPPPSPAPSKTRSYANGTINRDENGTILNNPFAKITALSLSSGFSPHESNQKLMRRNPEREGKSQSPPPRSTKSEVIHAAAEYEIRRYPPAVIAEFTYDLTQFKGNKDRGFTLLVNYIGALGNPQNAKESEEIAMTAPVMTKGGGGGWESKAVTMQFILPAYMPHKRLTMMFFIK